MADTEGVDQLFPGWSSVVHRPSEDPEPSDLPSTVDMNAVFNAEVNAAPATNVQEDESSDSDSDSDSDSNNSGSDDSGSCSQSDSSDSDSSSTSQDSNSRAASPEFSVLSSQTNGLRLTIQTVRKSCNSPTERQNKTNVDTRLNVKCSNLSSSSSEGESDGDNESEPKSDGSKSGGKSVKESAKKQLKKVQTKLPEKKVEKKAAKKECSVPSKDGTKKQKGKKERNAKMASLPISRGSTCSSSDSDDSDADSAMLASCSLQEINQEDLAAILPDQQEIDTFGEFECRKDKNYSQNEISGDASGSDMELPQQAVNALIQRTTESSSECESQEPPNPSSLCANSLLQQFFTQTQMLSAPTAAPPIVNNDAPSNNTTSNTDNQSHPPANDSEGTKRKRGRPRKLHKSPVADNVKKNTTNKDNVDYTADPNVSPDSGIQNSPDHVSSPEASPLPNNKNKIRQDSKQKVETKPDMIKTTKSNLLSTKLKEQNKLPVTSNRFDRVLYGNTDRVLYPPRRKAGRPPVNRKGPGRPPKHKVSITTTEVKTEEVKQSKLPVKQDKVEIKSRSKKIQKVPDKEIIQLTTNTNSLTLGKSSEVDKNKSKELSGSKKPKTFVISQICERVSKRLEQSGKIPQKIDKNDNKSKNRNQKSICKISVLAKGKVDKLRNKYTTLKNAKVMHSRHKHKKHKKCKFRILKPITAVPPHADPKISVEIEKLVQDFVKLCNISPKPVKEVIPEAVKAFKKTSKKRKASDHSERKKKKQNTTNSVNKETSNEQRLPLKKRHYHLNANNDSKQEDEVVAPIPIEIDKNDKKLKENKLPQAATKPAEKKIESGKIPLNKTPPNKNNSSPKASGINNNEYEVGSHIDEAIEACITKYSKDGSTKIKDSPEEKTNVSMTTPKKRHLLEIANNTRAQALNATKTNLLETLKTDDIAKKPVKSIENVVSEIKMKRLSPKFTETKKESVVQMITRKKNRLEDLTLSLVSKINTPPSDEQKKKIKSEEVANRASVIKYPVCKKAKPAEPEKLDLVVDAKPTGIFTPTVDLEIHIPKSPAVNDKETPIKEEKIETKKEPEPVYTNATSPEVAKIKNSEILRKRIRKRRAINRTGFPTVKKKKKKISSESVTEVEKEESKECDRVPKEGEEYATFVQRTECQVSIVALEKLQIPPPEIEDAVSKWEVLSECDSLPQDERTEYEDLKSEKKRDISPATSIETRSSDRIKKRRDFTPDGIECQTDDDLTLEARLKRYRRFSKRHRKLRELRGKGIFKFRDEREFVKRKLREISPASSIEPMTEKRLREDRGSASGDDKKNRKAPRWRKKYLVAGLFSDYYKEDDETARQKRAELVSNKSRLVYNPEEHPYGLLPAPYHCGKYLRCRKIPFQLPYDLWWHHTHSQLPGRDTVPSWNYRKIRSNVYNVKLTTTGACEPQSCNCGPTSSCGDDCINRLVLVECPASHKCQNQRIQRHEWAPGLEKFMTESKGWGVRTALPIKSGEFILEYVGEVVSDQEFKERMATRYVHDTHHYCLHLDCGLVIDGHRMGGDGRFVNHSCQPNCEMQKWSVNSQSRMALFALRDIEAGEELTYDYNFSLFNPAEGQECKCGSDNCRGVIGGKSQRVRQSTAPPPTTSGTGRVGRPRKNQAKRTMSGPKETPVPPAPPPVIPTPQLKPLTHAQKLFIQQHHCFLLRNFYKVRRCKAAGSTVTIPRPQISTPTETNPSTTLINHINALRQPRNIKTRRLAQVEDDPELHKTAKLANLLRDLWNIVTKAKDEKDQQLCAAFINLPSKRKVPEYYQRIQDPIDFTVIEQNVASGVYRTAESFDFDMNKLFSNAIRFYGRTSELGIAATRLKKIYTEAKQQSAHKFQDMLGGKPLLNFISNKKKGEEEDVIRCICGMFRDEGLMIQCERCLVWQHCECVKADPAAASYHCERCVPRDVDYEIPLDEYTEHGYRYYMTLMRGTLQLRQGDTVYVLRDIPIPGTNKKHTYDTVGEIKYSDLDIFRIERLWKDFKGQRIAYGHHYLRPHETYHEPTRKFFPNEVMRVPLYEAVPVELVIEHCWVMDFNTYCKGRPIGAPEDHIYICEYRVDKTARLFSKVSKSKFPMCTKSYAFERFDTRLKMSRTYTPHDLDPAHIKPRGRKPQDSEEGERREIRPVPVHIPIVRTRSEQKARLNKILLNLLSKLPTKQPLDVSYLLEGGRRRKKTT